MPASIADIKQLVLEAGQIALGYYGRVSRSVKADASVVTEADHAIEVFLRSSLTALAPDYGYIGEETEDSLPPRHGEDHVWIVDALDGSRAFFARMPLWTPAVCLMKGDRPVAGAAINPITGELFWAAEEGPAYCCGEILRPAFPATLEPNTFIFGPTNHHRTFASDFPGRIYCLGAPIYQLCLVAKGAASALFFDPSVNLWDLAFPSLLFERTGAVMVYASGRPVNLADLRQRGKVPEPFFAGGPAIVEILRRRITYRPL